jgi:hypothetical protein
MSDEPRVHLSETPLRLGLAATFVMPKLRHRTV